MNAASFALRSLLVAAALAAGAASAQPAAPADAASMAAAAASAGQVAPPLPRPEDTEVQRQKSQPGNNAPFWRAVRESGRNEGITSLPGAEKGVLIQKFVQYPGSRYTNAGEAWREVRNRWLVPYGGSFLVIALVALALYYWRRGPLGGHVPETGRVIERFTPFERAAHWTNAIAFVLLGVSGLVMAFGKSLLLPVLGGALFGWLTYALKTIHNFAGPLFAVSLLVVFVTFVRDNFPSRDDLNWLRHAGGAFGGTEPPSRRFNAGEKIVFWGGVLLLGATMVGSGLVLDKLIPGVGDVRGDMQVAHMIHLTAGVLMLAVFFLHIYLGTIGMHGAYDAMRHGYVDEGWAQEHHALWYEDIRAGRIPAQRSPEPAPAPLADGRPA